MRPQATPRIYWLILPVLLACTWWLMEEAPRRMLSRSLALFQEQQRMLARQGAGRIGAVLGEFLRRLSDPMVLDASGLNHANDASELEAAMQRLLRTHEEEIGVILMVADDDGELRASYPKIPGQASSVFDCHAHCLARARGKTTRVCTRCLRPFGAVAVNTRLANEMSLGASLDLCALAGSTLEDLVTMEGGIAWLLDESGNTLYATSDCDAPGPDTIEDYVMGRATLDKGSPRWEVVVAIPREVVASSVLSEVRHLVLAAGALSLLCFSGLLLFSVHQRRQHLEELRRLNRYGQQEKLATLGLLAAGLEHEVRSGLGISLSFVEFAEEETGDQSVREHLDTARETMRRLLVYSEELSRYVQGETADASLPGESVLLEEVIAEARALLVPMLKGGRPVELRVNAEEGVEACIHRGSLLQVLVNLLLNAHQALDGHDDGHLHLEVWRIGGNASLVIEDNGPGVPPEDRAQIFDPLFTTKAGMEGTGLGLWISRRLIEEAGGKIECTERNGGGARFEILLESPEDLAHTNSADGRPE